MKSKVSTLIIVLTINAEIRSETTTTVSTNLQSTSTIFTLNSETTSLPESVIIAAIVSASVLILAIFMVTFTLAVCCLLYSKNRTSIIMNESQENNVSESQSSQIMSNPAYNVHDGTHLMSNNPAYNTLDSQLMNNPAYNLSSNQTEPYYSVIAT